MIAERAVEQQAIDRLRRHFRFEAPDLGRSVLVEVANDAGVARHVVGDFLGRARTACR